MALKDDKELRIFRLTTRTLLVEHFAEHLLLSLPKEEALAQLRDFAQSLQEQAHRPFPNVPDAATSDLASAEFQDEVDYLKAFIKTLAAKVIQESE